MPEQKHCRSPPETGDYAMAASDEPQPQMPGLGDPTARRSAVVTDGAGEEELLGAEGSLPDLVLVGMPCGTLLLAPTPLSSMKPQYEEVSAPPPAAPPSTKKQCVQCGATETPQWRIHPKKGRGALCCNACRIGHRRAEALRDPVLVHVHLPQPATATATATVWISDAWKDFDAFLLKGTYPSARRENPSPTTEPAPAPEEKKQKSRKRKPLHPRNLKSSKKRCFHCKSASTLQWRTVVMDEHLPAPPGHAGGDDQLLMGKMDAIDGSPETHVVYGVGDDLPMGDPSSLDQFLFDGLAAPMLIDGDGDDDKDLVD